MTRPRRDTFASIWRGGRQFFSGTLLSRITGMLRDVCMAFAFGSHASAAAFLMAFRFAHLFRRILGEGSLQSAVVPLFEELRQECPLKAGAFFRDLFYSLSLVIFALVLLAEIGVLGAIYLGDLSPGTVEVLQLTALMLPSLFFICFFGLNVALLQCEHRYFLAGVAPALFNLVWIMAALWLQNDDVSWAMQRLAVAILLASFMNWALTVPSVLSILRALRLRSMLSGIRVFSTTVRRLWRPMALGIVGVSASQLNSAFDVIFARWADPSGPAYLWYALRLQQLPVGLFGVALAGALLPSLSRALRQGDSARYLSFLREALYRSFLLMFPSFCFLIVGGVSVLGALYGRGDFDQVSTLETTLCLWAYVFSLLPSVCVMILAPAFYARANYSTPTRSSLISVAVNLCMNYVLVACLGYGAWSVAAATSLASLCNALLLLWAFRRDLGVSPLPPLRSLLRPITFAFFASAVCLLLLAGIFPAQLPSLIWQGGVIERRLSMQLLGCGSITLLYGCIYLAGVRKQLLA